MKNRKKIDKRRAKKRAQRELLRKDKKKYLRQLTSAGDCAHPECCEEDGKDEHTH